MTKIFRPGDAGYNDARTTWALVADLRPAAVAFPSSVAEAAEVVKQATSEGMRVAPLGTGHNAHPLGDLSNSMLVRTSCLSDMSIDKRARVAAGAVWGPIAEQASALGLAALHGSSPDAGVVGYTLGGGINWYGRSKGLAVNTVTAVELITADGTLVRTDADHDADLFWALRGGGAANFGLVTALEFDLFPLKRVYAGMMRWDIRDAPEVLSRWTEMVASAPEDLTLAYRHMNFPPIPEVPKPLRGRSLVIVDGVALGTSQGHLKALRDLSPEVDTFAEVPPSAVVRIHMDPEHPTPGWGRSTLLDAFPPAAANRVIEVAGIDSGNDLALAVEVRHLGGAMGRPVAGGGALSAIDGQFQLVSGGMMVAGLAEQTLSLTERVITSLGEWSRGREYLNFQEEKVAPARAFDASTLHKLRAIRDQIDPDHVFQANHEL
ncbi:FAD-binding oxidoreductase [Actinoplanes sp. NPDC051343]|uniref:FAD-binding oxidoreductase n=1 Tax=Actinoplanes sp. NPDC051343 TaxID=3363906 RepID=UPI0037A238B7